jgi:predicted dehydrogenase
MTNGVIATYRGSWCAEGHNTSWESEWRAIGTKGTALWDGGDDIRGQAAAGKTGFLRKQKSFEVSPGKMPHRGHDALIREFVRCIRTGRQPQTVCTDNIKSLAMVFAAVESAETRRRIRARFPGETG